MRRTLPVQGRRIDYGNMAFPPASEDTALKFCMITIFYPPYSFGGDSIYLQRLCSELVARGHEVDVIHCADSFHIFRDDVDPKAFPVSEGMTIHRLRSRFGTLSPLLSHQTGGPVLTGGEIARILQSKAFDVVHYHNISLFGPKVLEIEARGNPTKLYTAHDHWLVCPTSVLYKNQTHACDEPTCLSCTVRSKRPPQLWRYTGLLDRCVDSVDQFISPSRFSAGMHGERGFTRDMKVLNYFLHPIRESPGGDTPPHPRPYFLFVGRLESYKGVQDVIPAFAGPGDYDLVIVGSGAYEEPLKRQAAGMERVKFAGWVSQADLGDYYKHALASLTPSTTYETFGIVVIESYSRRTPVIVRDLGPLPEVVEEGQGGMTFSNLDELKDRLDRMYRDSELRERLGRQGYDAFQAKWTADPHIARYTEIIEAARG